MAQQSSSSSRIALRIIVVDAIQQADQICRRLSKGEDFAALATENSTDATNQQGGLMGKVDPSTLRPELRDALKHLNPAKRVPLSSFSSGGYAILKILFPSEWRNSPRSQERSKSLWMGKFRRKTKLRQYSICYQQKSIVIFPERHAGALELAFDEVMAGEVVGDGEGQERFRA